MDKVWYIKIFKVEGPFSIAELKRDSRITPDTLAWRPGLPNWTPIRNIPELKKLFKDENQPSKIKIPQVLPNGTLAIDYQKDPHHFLWIFLIIFVIIYLFFQFYHF